MTGVPSNLKAGSPLSGIVVVEFGGDVGVAFAARMLAGYGAEVIKVEPPAGDRIRFMPPLARELGPTPTHAYLDAGKKSVCLDITSQLHVKAMILVLETADVLLIGFPKADLHQLLGLSPSGFRQRFPELMIVSNTPYGESGPRAGRPATALTSFAAGGQMAVSGNPEREPIKTYGYQAEYQAGMHLFGIVLAGAYKLRTAGPPGDVELSVQEAQASSLEGAGPRTFNGAPIPPRVGNTLSPIWRTYPCQDGYAGVWVNPPNVQSFFMSLGRPDLAEKFRTQMPGPTDPELEELVGGLLAPLTREEVLALAVEKGIPLSYVATLDDVLESPHIAATDLWLELGPEAGRYKVPGTPIRSAEMTFELTPAPELGEHTVDVLRSIGGLEEPEIRQIEGDLARLREDPHGSGSVGSQSKQESKT